MKEYITWSYILYKVIYYYKDFYKNAYSSIITLYHLKNIIVKIQVMQYRVTILLEVEKMGDQNGQELSIKFIESLSVKTDRIFTYQYFMALT